MSSSEQPVSFADFPAEAFPFVVQMFAAEDPQARQVLWSTTVAGPGALVIPAMGRRVWVRMRWPDGSVTDAWPDE